MMLKIKCVICNEKEAKYKCPTCRTPYCSVACCKTHKESPSCKPLEPNQHEHVQKQQQQQFHNKSTTQHFQTEDTVPPEKLALLGGNAELRAVLGNPHLQAMLKGVDSAANASAAMEAAMQEPIFTEFVDICMKIVDPETSSEL